MQDMLLVYHEIDGHRLHTPLVIAVVDGSAEFGGAGVVLRGTWGMRGPGDSFLFGPQSRFSPHARIVIPLSEAPDGLATLWMRYRLRGANHA